MSSVEYKMSIHFENIATDFLKGTVRRQRTEIK